MNSKDANSKHPDVRRLYDAAGSEITLTPAEQEHLATCEECQELVRTFHVQQLGWNKSSRKKAG